MLGSIAQLVQSVCLTSRGSGVRLPLLPQKNEKAFSLSRSFSMYAVSTNPRPVGGRLAPAVGKANGKIFNPSQLR